MNSIFINLLGMRASATKVVILLTDGTQNPKKYDPVKASKPLYDAGAKIFAIGISDGVDEKQLEDITRDKNRVFFAASFDKLDSSSFVDKITGQLCTAVSPPGK